MAFDNAIPQQGSSPFYKQLRAWMEETEARIEALESASNAPETANAEVDPNTPDAADDAPEAVYGVMED